MRRLQFLLFTLLVLLGGCGLVDDRSLVVPNVYKNAGTYPADAVPIGNQTSNVEVLYVTNREKTTDGSTRLPYTRSRSDAMALGIATINLGSRTWPELVRRSEGNETLGERQVRLSKTHEAVRFSDVPLPVLQNDGRAVTDPAAQRAYDKQVSNFRSVISDHLSRTKSKRVLLFVHGVNNEFDDSAIALANIWHFTGRDSVPIVFSWPAGNSGLLGYFRDREAGEFSIFHLKELLRSLARIDDLAGIDIVAHSRGTDITGKAVRELVIEHRFSGADVRRTMKTGMLIFAAADIDTGVIRMRLAAERVEEAFEQMNFYVNPADRALRLSSLLTKGSRFGAINPSDLTSSQLESLRRDRLVHFIQVDAAKNPRSHSYFRNNPAVLSDIILALKTRAQPGSAIRPMEQTEKGFWLLHKTYPAPPAKQQENNGPER